MNMINWCTEHKQIWRLNHDCPMFARVKYLVITELTLATLFAQVFVMRHQMSCCPFLCLSSGLTCSLLKNHRTPYQFFCFVLITPVQYHSTSLNTMIVSQSSRGIMGSYYAFKGYSASSQGGSSWPSPLRSDGSWYDHAGEAGPVEP